MINRKQFKVIQLQAKQFVSEYSLDRFEVSPDSEMKGLVLSVAKSFAVGDRITEYEHESRHVESWVYIPRSPIDWVKTLIVDWQPSLNFGWLTPALKKINTQVTHISREKNYNVYPVEPQGKRVTKEIIFAETRHPSPLEWLSSDPPTQKQIMENEAQIKMLSANEAARRMAFDRVFGGEELS